MAKDNSRAYALRDSPYRLPCHARKDSSHLNESLASLSAICQKEFTKYGACLKTWD
jgi:hypothetical protein